MCTYTITAATKAMDNHIPAAAFDAQAGFHAAAGSQGDCFLAAVGSDGHLRINAQSALGGPWVSVDLADDLTGLSASGVLKSFQMTADNSAQTVTMLAVITAGEVDAVYAMVGSGDTAQADWLDQQATRTWIACAFNATGVSVTARNLVVDRLVPQRLVPGGASTAAMACAVVVDPVTLDRDVFLFNLPKAAGDTPQWTASDLPYGAPQILDCAMGYLPGAPNALFALVASDVGGNAIVYGSQPDNQLFNHKYALAQSVTAMAAVTYPSNSATVTDLFTTDGTSIYYYPAAGRTPCTILTGSLVAGASELHAACDGNTVSVWGLANGNVFFATAYCDVANDAANWSFPTIVASGVTSLATAASSAGAPVSLFALSAQPAVPPTRQGSAASGSAPSLAHYSRTLAGVWKTTAMVIPSTTGYVRLCSNTTRMLVTDANSIPQAATTISLTTGVDARLLVNGQYVAFTANTAQNVQTDSGGYVTVVETLSSMAPVSMAVTAGSTTVTVNASKDIATQLTAAARAGAATLTYVNDDGTASNLFGAGVNIDQMNQTLTAVAQCMANLPSQSIGGDSARRRPELGFSLGHVFGDLVQLVRSAISTIDSAVITCENEVYTLVVTIGDDVYSATIACVEDAIHAISAVVEKAVADFEKVFRWLGFIFAWTDIKTAQAAFVTTYNGFLSDFVAGASKIETTLTGDIASAITKLQNSDIASKRSGTISAYVTANGSQGGAANGVDVKTNPQMSWVSQQLSSGNGQSAQGATRRPAAAVRSQGDTPAALTAFLSDMVNQAGSITSSIASTLITDVESVLPGGDGTSVGAVFDDFATGAAVDVLQGVSSASADIFQNLASLDSVVADQLNNPIEVPVLSGLYQDVVGTPPTILNLVCLCQAVVFTLAYKLVEEKALPTDLSTAISGPLNSALGGLTGVAQQRAARRDGDGDGDDSVITYMKGAVLVVRAFTTMLYVDAAILVGKSEDAPIAPLCLMSAIDMLCGLFCASVELAEQIDDDGAIVGAGLSTVFNTLAMIALMGALASSAGAVSNEQKEAARTDSLTLLFVASILRSVSAAVDMIDMLLQEWDTGDALASFAEILGVFNDLLADNTAATEAASGLAFLRGALLIVAGAVAIGEAYEADSATLEHTA